MQSMDFHQLQEVKSNHVVLSSLSFAFLVLHWEPCTFSHPRCQLQQEMDHPEIPRNVRRQKNTWMQIVLYLQSFLVQLPIDI